MQHFDWLEHFDQTSFKVSYRFTELYTGDPLEYVDVEIEAILMEYHEPYNQLSYSVIATHKEAVTIHSEGWGGHWYGDHAFTVDWGVNIWNLPTQIDIPKKYRIHIVTRRPSNMQDYVDYEGGVGEYMGEQFPYHILQSTFFINNTGADTNCNNNLYVPGTNQPTQLGDINNDGWLNVADIVTLGNFVFFYGKPSYEDAVNYIANFNYDELGVQPCHFDINGDGVIDILDIVALINLTLAWAD